MNLNLEYLKHTEQLFQKHIRDFHVNICPINGEISYIDGKVQCSIHSDRDHEGDRREEVASLKKLE